MTSRLLWSIFLVCYGHPRAGHYIFAQWFLLSFFLSFFLA